LSPGNTDILNNLTMKKDSPGAPAESGEAEKPGGTSLTDEVATALSSPPPTLSLEPGARVNSRSRALPVILNRINYAHFQESFLLLRLKHQKFPRSAVYPVSPLPCKDNTVSLTWIKPPPPQVLLSHRIDQLIIPGDEKIITLDPLSVDIGENGVTLILPEEGAEFNCRSRVRYSGQADVTMVQNGTSLSGKLEDFSSAALKVILDPADRETLHWFNKDEPLILTLKSPSVLHLSGEYRILHLRGEDGPEYAVLASQNDNIRRYKAKEYRGLRFIPAAPLYLRFTHPLSHLPTELRVRDFSGSGFSVELPEYRGCLTPGLFLTDTEIILPGGEPLSCTMQVLHRRVDDGNEVYGLAIIDMDPARHVRLLQHLQQLEDPHSFIDNNLDMDALWEFFFTSGFIYPQKYSHLRQNREEVKELYEKLYLRTPSIARHFIYREGREIRGHMAMLRTYEEGWLLHHHASRLEHNSSAGLHVLNQVGSFGNNSHRIQSLKMKYLLCYYQKENKFPRRIFGDIAEKINDPRSCSLDDFSYFHLPRGGASSGTLPEGWTLTETDTEDRADLKSFYQLHSRGMMLEALNLKSSQPPESLYREYRKAGLFRDIQTASLRHDGELQAVIMMDRSEGSLNMSDLTNCFKVFVTAPEKLSPEILRTALQFLSGAFEGPGDPAVLLYPAGFGNTFFQSEKTYTLWIINMESSDKYFRYLKTLLRFAKH